MAAYGFSEGAGTTTSDASSNSVVGTLSGATWTAGKNGAGLSFNGTSSFVNLGNPAALKLTGSLTLSVWVNESANVANDGIIVSKSNGNGGWELKSSPDTGSRTFAIMIYGPNGSYAGRYSTTVRALNTWYHVAGVYNATARTLDIYVNGVLNNGATIGTVPASISDPAVNANVGRRSDGFYVRGTIDDLRIYNQALAAADIQADMNTAVGPAATDTTPPTVPTGVVATGFSPTQINLSWVTSTDNVAVSGYKVFRNGTQVGTSLSASYSDTGLLPSSSYSYAVSSYDSSGNESPRTVAVSGATQDLDATPPTVAVSAPMDQSAVAGAAVSVSATAADNVGVAGLQFLLDGANLGTERTVTPYSITWNTTTASGGVHLLSARARDAQGNQGIAPNISVTVDNTPRSGTVIINSNAAATNSLTATLSLSATDGQSSVTQMRFSNTGTSFSAAEAFAATKVWSLASGAGTKTVYAQFKDAAGNWSASATDTIVYDTTAPTISAVASSNIAGSSATITWTTTETATSQVEYGVTNSYGQLTPIDSALVTAHSVSLSALAPSTKYNFRVRSIDAAGNEKLGTNNSFKTAATAGTTPTIVSLAPTSGPIATPVTISGSNFGASIGTSTVTFGGVAATPTTWTATSLNVPVPAGAATGNVVVTVNAVPSNGLSFTVTGPPTVTSLTPNTGPTGTLVTIAGANFGATMGTSNVTFAGVSATPTTWTATSITVPVPAGATTGNVVVTVNGIASNPIAYTVKATAPISFVQQNYKTPQGSTTAVAVPFAAAQTMGNLNVVIIAWDDVVNTIRSVSDTSGNVYVPAVGPTVWSGTATQWIYYAKNIRAAAANANTVTVTFSGGALYPDVRIAEYSGLDSAAPFDVAVGQAGSSTTSSSGAVVTTNADDLLVAGNYVQQLTSGAGASFTSRVITNPDQDILEDRVVSSVGSYTATAPVSGGGWIMQMVAFRAAIPATAPAITSLAPASGPVGTLVTIGGTNFGGSIGTVTFAGVTAVPTTWTATSLVVPVPAGASTGNVVVTANGLPSNAFPFTVTAAPPRLDTLSPMVGSAGTLVMISGANFGATQGTVTFRGIPATPISWSPTTIVVPVPAGASTGRVLVQTTGGVGSNGIIFDVLGAGLTLTQHLSHDFGITASGSLTLSAPTTAGNFIVVALTAGAPGEVFTVADTTGNTYRSAIQLTDPAVGATLALFYAEGIRGGTNTISVSDTVNANLTVAILEYSGVLANNSFEAASVASGFGSSPASGNTTAATAGDLVLGVVSTANPAAIAAGTGYRLEEVAPGSPVSKLAVEDQILASSGPASSTATLAAADNWLSGVAAFRTSPSIPPPVISVSLSPASTSTLAGKGTQTFQATVLNDSQNRGAVFALSGTGCSGSTCGALSNVTSTSALYTAPATAPTPNIVTLVATAIGDPSATATAVISVTTGGFNVVVSPKRSSLTTSKTQAFVATVTGDSLNAGVVWTVDAVPGGNSSTGTITPDGLFTPGTQTGIHIVVASSVSSPSTNASATVAVTDLAGVFTHHNDVARTGQNLQEYALSPATVSATTFGRLFSCPVDGFLYAQPLYVANLSVGGVMRNVFIVATESDSVYEFDADDPSCNVIWYRSFLGPGVTSMPWQDAAPDPDLQPQIGITSTPVIDPATATVYIEAKTKETVGTGCSTSNPCYVHRLHALDLNSGAEKLSGPVVISAPGFVSQRHLQRPALLLSNGTVYLGFGAHSDYPNWQGWVFGYSASTLTPTFVLTTTDQNAGANGGGVWQSGAGLAADASGNVWFETGNGTFNADHGGRSYGDSVLKVDASGHMVDYFTPYNQALMESLDLDLASAGVTILPDAVGSVAHPHLAIATGKVGVLYLLDQTNLGQFRAGSNRDVQEVTVKANNDDLELGIDGQPAYWNGNLYVVAAGDPMRQYTIANGALSTSSVSNTNLIFPIKGAVPSVSANGTNGGIVWALDLSGWVVGTSYQGNSSQPVEAVLHAYDARNLATELYSSPVTGQGAAPAAVRYTVPVVANGKVYVGGQSSVSVFGLLPD